jgi:iron complex outermembrane receptor protein
MQRRAVVRRAATRTARSLAVLAVLGAGAAHAATTSTPVIGSLGVTEVGCPYIITLTFGAGENCTYGGTTFIATLPPPFGESTGPYSTTAFYDFATTPAVWSVDYVPTFNDQKIQQRVAGSVTVDDNGTPANGADDRLGFSLTLTTPSGGDILRRINNNVVDRYSSMTQVLAPAGVTSATPNATGGFDYVIASDGFPALLPYADSNDPANNGRTVGSVESLASFSGGVIDPLRWTDWPANAGFGSLEGNFGVRTTGTITNPQCINRSGRTDCRNSTVSFGPREVGPNQAPGGGSTAEDVGWDQLLLRVSTDADGLVVAMAGFTVEEFKPFGTAPCGTDQTATNACDSFNTGYFTATSVRANDDGPIAIASGGEVTIDVLANDTNFADPVTVTIVTPPASGTAEVRDSPGNASVVRVRYTSNPGSSGLDTFVYQVSDGTSTGTATVTVDAGNLVPVATDGSIAGITTIGVAPLAATGTFTAPGPGGSLGNEGPRSEVRVVVDPAFGTTSVSGNVITYTVTNASFVTGTDQFTYQVRDDDEETDTGVVTITLLDGAPTIADGAIFADEDRTSAALALGITAGNGSPELHTLVVSAQAANGTCALTAPNATGRVTYRGNDGFSGTDSCQLTLTDLDGDVDTAVISVNVNELNEVTGTVGGAGAVDGAGVALLGLLAALRRRRRPLAAVPALALLAVTPALAQEAAAGPEIGEIIVTTRKVAESLKDVPLSITAFDSTTIQQAGITNLTDVAELTPGLSFFNALGETLPVPVIRGIAPTDIFGQNNAAVFVDGVFISGREGLNFSQLDLERIEVVKGPQSAQYGRNAFSGALNYVTKDPGDELEGRALVETGNDGKRRGLAMISGPILGETLTGRVSFLYDEWDGSYDNPLSDVDVGGYRYRSWQAKLLWKPNDDLRVSLAYYKSNDDIDDPAVVALASNCEDRIGDGNSSVRFQNFCGEVPELEDIPGQNGSDGLQKVSQATGENRDLDRLILRADWEVEGLGTFTSLTGFSDTEQNSVFDFGRGVGENQPFLYCIGLPGPLGAPNNCASNPADQTFFTGVYNPEIGSKNQEWSQEIRFATDQDRRWRAVVGAFAFRTRQKEYEGTPIATQPLPVTPPGTQPGLAPFDPTGGSPDLAIGSAIFYTVFTPDGGLDPLRRPIQRLDTDAWATFASLDFDFTDRLTGRAEVRFAQDRLGLVAWRYQRCAPFTGDLDPQPGTPCPDVASRPDDVYDLRVNAPVVTQTLSDRFNQLVGRVGLDFKLTDDWLLYASVAEGDKPGGVELVEVAVVLPPPDPVQDRLVPNSFRTERLTAYEIGAKGFLFDGRLSIDGAVYYNDWRDIVLRQLTENDPISGLLLDQAAAFRENSGSADVFGAEVALGYAFTDRLTGTASVGWVKAELKDTVQENLANFPTFAPDGDISGNSLLRQPEWDASVSLSYKRELVADWDWYLRGDASYQSDVYVGNDNQSWLPARTYVNARLGFKSSRFGIELWGRNLFDNGEPVAAFRDIYFANTDTVVPPYANYGPRPDFDKFVPFRYSVSYPRERTYGINFEMRFGALAQ